ncbi:MAG: lipocalin family protein [Alphaproteobacteria bacterium]|nr:lipocalin family protein [Alphaproteobacteria bacterium]
MMKRLVGILLVVFVLQGCSEDLPLETVQHVDINRYMGKWYEIASFPAWFQRNCTGSTATYSLKRDGTVNVLNRCFKNTLNGSEDIAKGSAYVVDTDTQAKLKVSFFWPFYGDYWIIDLADDYSYAVVGHPNRKYLWILSRTPQLSKQIYDTLLLKMQQKGFDISKLNKTIQPREAQ